MSKASSLSKIQVKVSWDRKNQQNIRLISKSQILQNPLTLLNQKKSALTIWPLLFYNFSSNYFGSNIQLVDELQYVFL